MEDPEVEYEIKGRCCGTVHDSFDVAGIEGSDALQAVSEEVVSQEAPEEGLQGNIVQDPALSTKKRKRKIKGKKEVLRSNGQERVVDVSAITRPIQHQLKHH